MFDRLVDEIKELLPDLGFSVVVDSKGVDSAGRPTREKIRDGRRETLAQSLSRFSEKVLLILSSRSDVTASARKIGPAPIFERIWKELGSRR